jgi:hypothetical protein
MHSFTRFATVLTLMFTLVAGTLAAPVVPEKVNEAKGEGSFGDTRVLTVITGSDLNEILKDAGYTDGKVDEDGDVFIKIEDRAVYFLVAPNRESIQAKAAWRTSDSSRPSADKVNGWNRSKKYSKAYFDEDRDPVLQLDLDIAGGVTVARIKDFALTVRASIIAFTSEVLQ